MRIKMSGRPEFRLGGFALLFGLARHRGCKLKRLQPNCLATQPAEKLKPFTPAAFTSAAPVNGVGDLDIKLRLTARHRATFLKRPRPPPADRGFSFAPSRIDQSAVAAPLCWLWLPHRRKRDDVNGRKKGRHRRHSEYARGGTRSRFLAPGPLGPCIS